MTGWELVQDGWNFCLQERPNLAEIFHPFTESKVACTSRGCTYETASFLKCLVEHCQKVHNWKEIPCQFDNCNFVAYNVRTLAAHQTFFHSKHRSFSSKDFSCNWVNCNSSFPSQANLQKHIRIHTNNLLECDFCPYRTNEIAEFKNHCRLHFKMFNYKCEYCEKRFVSKKQLNDHFGQYHTEETFTCHICKAYSDNRKKLQKHIVLTHNLLTRWNDDKKMFDTFSRSKN